MATQRTISMENLEELNVSYMVASKNKYIVGISVGLVLGPELGLDHGLNVESTCGSLTW